MQFNTTIKFNKSLLKIVEADPHIPRHPWFFPLQFLALLFKISLARCCYISASFKKLKWYWYLDWLKNYIYLNKFAFTFKDKHFMFMTTFYPAPPILTNRKETAKHKKVLLEKSKEKLKPKLCRQFWPMRKRQQNLCQSAASVLAGCNSGPHTPLESSMGEKTGLKRGGNRDRYLCLVLEPVHPLYVGCITAAQAFQTES